MGFGGISIECLVTVLYGLFPVFLPLGHAQRGFIPPATLSGTKMFFKSQ